jgi:hypothetical protein
MSEDDKAPAMTIRIPAPRVLAEAAAKRPDARTAEVLRALHRAKGTIMGTDVPASSPSTETLAWELRALHERLASCAGILERAVIVPSEKLADFQRSQDGAVRDLREAVHALKRQADALAAWRAWWARHVATFSLTVALLLAGGIGLAWKAHSLATSTHDILAQILANQESAQAAKAGKRR